MANPVGRPKIFKNKEELQEKLDAYKKYLLDETKPPTIAGLAYYTGIDRQTLYNYKKDAQFFDTIKTFVDWILMTYEETSINNSSGGIVFLLKNYGYTDKVETVNLNNNVNQDVTELTKEERQARIDELLNKK